MRTHHLKYFLCHHSHSHIIFPWILTCLRWRSNIGSYNIFIEIRIVAHSDIYITVRQMSPSSGNTFHTATHSWDAVLQVALEMAGNEREMAGKKEGKLKGSVSFSFIRSHTHWQPFNMFDFEKKKNPDIPLDVKILIFLLLLSSLTPSSCHVNGRHSLLGVVKRIWEKLL